MARLSINGAKYKELLVTAISVWIMLSLGQHFGEGRRKIEYNRHFINIILSRYHILSSQAYITLSEIICLIRMYITRVSNA